MEREYRPRLRALVHEKANPKVDPSEMRKFAYPVGLALAVIAGLSFWRDHLFAARLFDVVSDPVIGNCPAALKNGNAVIVPTRTSWN